MALNTKMIVPSGFHAGYLEARRIVAERGMRLPSNVLHDDYLVRTERWEEVRKIYPAWGREVLVHPERNGEFARGKDVVDSYTGWRLPADYLANPDFVKADVFRKGIGLVVDPEDVRKDGSMIVVVPASIIVLHPFMQESGTFGKMDQDTRLPLSVYPKKGEEKRGLLRINGVGVRPLARDINSFDRHNWQNIIIYYEPEGRLGVAGEDSERGNP